jgi:hypothetical protein
VKPEFPNQENLLENLHKEQGLGKTNQGRLELVVLTKNKGTGLLIFQNKY